MSIVDPLKGSIAAQSAARRDSGKRLRCTPADRKKSIEEAALRVLKKGGIASVSLKNVAAAAGCGTSLLGRYFPDGAESIRIAAINALASETGDSKALRKVFADGYDHKAKGLKLPKGFKL